MFDELSAQAPVVSVVCTSVVNAKGGASRNGSTATRDRRKKPLPSSMRQIRKCHDAQPHRFIRVCKSARVSNASPICLQHL
jgi:hypothetical protein